MTVADPPITAAAASRFWRAIAVASLAVLFVGTHWPSLHIPPLVGPDGEISQISPDKFLHFIGFGLLLVPWWWSGWFRRRWTLIAAAAAWSLFDEASQAILPIDRVFLAEDALCNLCGIAAAASVLAAAGPVGDFGGHARLLRERRDRAEDLLLARPSNWLMLGISAALAALVVSPLAAIAGPWLEMHPRVTAIAGGVLAAAAGGLIAVDRGIAAKVAWIRRERACLACGDAGGAVAANDCRSCGAFTPSAAWAAAPAPFAAAALLRAAWRPLLLASVAVIALVGLFLLLIADRPWSWSEAADRIYLGLNPATRIVIDLTLLIAAGAWAWHGTRRNLAAAIDRQHLRCRRCGFDLGGTPPDAATGCGRCGECGEAFLAPLPVAGERDRRDDAAFSS
jgi:hypothetical protein